MKTDTDFKIIFNGTEETFLEVLHNFNVHRDHFFKDEYRWTPDFEHFPNQSRKMIYLWNQVGHHKTLSFIKYQTLPQNRTLLLVHIYKADYQVDKPWWEILRYELDSQGWLIILEQPAKPDPQTATKDDWLRYFHDMKGSGYKYTLRDLSKDCFQNYDNVRKWHIGCKICK